MKRKLSLLMVLMMVVALVPANLAFAASDATVDTVVTTADGDPNFEMSIEPEGTGIATNGIFELSLGADAEFTGDFEVRYVQEDGTANTVNDDIDASGETRVEVDIEDIDTTGATVTSGRITDGTFIVSGTVDLDGAEEGEQKVTIESINNAGISREVLTYAVVSGDGDILSRRLEDSATLTRGQAVEGASFELRETDMTSLDTEDDATQTFEVTLPKDMAWAVGTGETTVEVNGDPVTTFDTETDNDRVLVITFEASDSRIDRVVVNPVISINKDASKGDVKVTFGADANDADSLVIGEYVDYGITVEVEEVKSIVAGRTYEDAADDEDYEVEITLDTAGNSFIINRPIDITVANGDLVITDIDGASSFESEDYDGDYTGTDAGYTDEFSVQAAESDENIVITGYVKADWDETEAVTVTVAGGGVEEQTVEIAEVVVPVTITTMVTSEKEVADVIVGLQDQEAPEITITETQAAALREGYYVIDFVGSRYDGIEFMETNLDFEVDGDLSVDDVTVEMDGERLLIYIDGESDEEASTITISGLEVTLDRSVPFGNINARFAFFGTDEPTTEEDYDDADDIIATIPFLNVVTAVQDERKQQTVFTIDSVTYTVGTETRTLDAAPFISMNRTMLPIGTVAQLVGATVNYSPVSRTAVFTKDNLVVSMNLDTNVLLVNGSPVMMDASPMIVNSRAFVPVVYVAQAFGIQNGTDIVYDAAQRTVTLFPEVEAN